MPKANSNIINMSKKRNWLKSSLYGGARTGLRNLKHEAHRKYKSTVSYVIFAFADFVQLLLLFGLYFLIVTGFIGIWFIKKVFEYVFVLRVMT